MTAGNDCPTSVLVLHPDESSADAICRKLKYLDFVPATADSSDGSDCVAAIMSPDDDALAGKIAALRTKNPDIPVLFVKSVPKGLDGPNWRLELPLKRCQLTRLLGRASRYYGRERRERITGQSHPIRQVRRQIEKVADFDTNVLITGQSGTGKELVAKTIHELSERAGQPFVPVNCGAIPAELLESELFGHEKGAFTGAIADRKGRFELAQGGTLFLDEIGEMSMDMQVKLLRVLQERSFEKVGSGKLQNCDVRIIAATHVDLPEAVRNNRFREDLYYRLNVFPIEMPPLYQRLSDLPRLLDELFIAHSGGKKGRMRVSQEALHALSSYSWPGNVRELANLVERLAILKPEGNIELADLPPAYRSGTGKPPAATSPVAEAMQMTAQNLKEHLLSVEQRLISEAMQASDGVVSQAAALLGVRRTTLVEKISRHQLA